MRDHAAPEFIEAVDRGNIPVSVAAGLATSSEAIQRRAVAEPERAHVLVKQERRANRETELAAKQLALPDGRFGVIYADPPWRFEPYSRDTGMNRDPGNHYPTSPTETIAALDVASIAAFDSVLFLWATAPTLLEALEVMMAWGWVSNELRLGEGPRRHGLWSRNQHEQLLVGVKGEIPAPAPGAQRPSLIQAPVREHSRKPEAFVEMIERLFPNLPKIELFARGAARPGWRAWGLEAEEA